MVITKDGAWFPKSPSAGELRLPSLDFQWVRNTFLLSHCISLLEFPGDSDRKKSTCQCRRLGFNPWVGKIPGEENGYQLAWKSPWAEEPGGLQSMGSQKSQTWLSDKQQQHQFAKTAITKYHRLGGSYYRNLLSHSSGGWKSKLRCLAGLVSSGASLPGLQMATFLLSFHITFSLSGNIPAVSSLSKETSHTTLGPHP